MPPSQVTFSVNLVAKSVKMKVKRVKKAEWRAESGIRHLRRQSPEALFETPGKGAGVVIANF